MFSIKSLIFLLLLLLLFLSYVSFLAFFSSSELPTKVNHGNFMPYLADKPISEDGFYMLTVAWNFGQGKVFAYNQDIKTSGVQPLSTLIFGGLAFLSANLGISKSEFPRVIILFSGFILVLFVIVLWNTLLSLFREYDKNILLFLCILFGLFNFDIFLNFMNGLETGLYLVMIVVSFKAFWALINNQSRQNILYAGVFFGFTSLARIDFLIISTVLLIAGVLFSKIKLKSAFTIQILQLIIISPWLIYTYNLTGSILQSSAGSQMSSLNNFNIAERLYYALLAVLQINTLNIYTGQKDLVLLILGFGFTIIFIVVFIKKRKIFSRLGFIYFTILVSFAVLVLSYIVISHATYFYFRYFSPFTIFVLLVIIPIVYGFLKGLSSTKYLFICLSFGAVFFAQSYLFFHSGKLGVHMSLRPAFIKANFVDSQLVGSYQSGVTGYYCENVMNLDGKINHLALKYSREGEIMRYIDSVGIDGLIEWKFAFPPNQNDKFYKNWIKLSENIGDNRTLCFKRK